MEGLTPPHNLEAERGVIGAILLEDAALVKARETITPQDFYSESHRRIFTAMLELSGKGEAIDLVTVSEAVGWQHYLGQIAGKVPTAANVRYHARIVREKAMARALLAFSSRIREAVRTDEVRDNLHNITGELQELLKLRERPEKLEYYEGADRIIPSTALRRKLDDESCQAVSWDTGLYGIDSVTRGVRTGELITVSGLTGEGKTTLARTFTANLASRGEACLWFTYEEGAAEFLEKFGLDLPLFYLPSEMAETSLRWIEERMIEAREKTNCRFVFIDHLHYLVPFQTQNFSILIGHVMRELKRLARKHDVAVFVIAHTQKIRPDSELDISNIRDSSFVGQESDTVLLIWRREKRESGAVVKIAKCRHTGKRNKKTGLIKGGPYLLDDYEEI